MSETKTLWLFTGYLPDEALQVQPDQIIMAVCFRYLVKSDASVPYCIGYSVILAFNLFLLLYIIQ